MLKHRWLVAVAIVAAACSDPIGTEVPRDATTVPATEIVNLKDAMSGFTLATRTVVANDFAWQIVWEQLYANRSDMPPLPAIDFTKDVVILVASGSRPTTGYSIAVREVKSHQGTLYVSVVERSPAAGCVTGQAVTAPVHVVSVPREGNNAQFSVAQETVSCN